MLNKFWSLDKLNYDTATTIGSKFMYDPAEPGYDY